MKQALQNGFIDAAVLATTPEEVLRGRGPKYTACPMIEGVWEAIDRGYEKIAMVGTLGGNLIRDVRPGEVLVIEPSGDLESQQLYRGIHSAHCVFEYIYFARPDSVLDGRLVYDVRMEIGARLAEEHDVDADIVSPVPDS